MKNKISVIILTYNEEKHIERCIKSLQLFVEQIFIIDSYSTDKTIQVAERLGVKVYQNKWENSHAKQFQWGLNNCPIKTKWVMKMDSDEYIEPELAKQILIKMQSLDDNINGIYLKEKFFLWINGFVGEHFILIYF